MARATFREKVWNKLSEASTGAVRLGESWTGDAFGWPAEYHPQQTDPPLDSNLRFTPADLCIGESGVWFFSLMWEHGKDTPPVEFLDDKSFLTRESNAS